MVIADVAWPIPLLSAFLGAVVGFAGTVTLQRRDFRQRKREQVHRRLGVIRALIADLTWSKIMSDGMEEQRVLYFGAHFPVGFWDTTGHHLLGFVGPDDGVVLAQTFTQLSLINRLLARAAAVQLQAFIKDGSGFEVGGFALDAEIADEQLGFSDEEFQKIQAGLTKALVLLLRLDRDTRQEELRLAHPFSFWLRKASKAEYEIS